MGKKKKGINPRKRINKKTKYYLIAFIVILIIIISVVVNGNRNKSHKESPNNENEGITLYDTNLGEYVKETEDGIKINTSEMLTTDKILDEYTITNIQLTAQSGITSLIATVENNSNETTKFTTITATFVDEEGKELYKAKGVIRSLGVGESAKLNISLSGNYVTAYNVKFSK